MKTHADRSAWLPLAIAASLTAFLPVAAHGYVGSFARYIADDFCTASTLRRLGFLASQANWYQTWTGRYSYTFVVTLSQVFGPTLTPWLPALALAAWAGAVVFAVRRLQGRHTPWILAAAIAGVHILSTLNGAPSVYQSLYWQTGMVTYTLPLILGLVYGAGLWHAVSGEAPPARTKAAVVSFVAAFGLGGFSETYVVLQTAALSLLLLSLPLSIAPGRRRYAAVVVGAGWIGSVLAGLAVALAPGTQVRRGLMPDAPGLAPWIEATLRDGYLFIARTVKGSPEAIALAILVPLLLIVLHGRRVFSASGPSSPRGSVLALLLIPMATPILMLATIAPYEYAISSYPDARVLITTMFVLVSGLVLWGGNLGNLLLRWSWTRTIPVGALAVALSVVVVVVLAWTSFRTTRSVLATAQDGRAYAEAWDTRDQKLRQVPVDSELVPAASLRHMGGLAEIGRDPREWINRCVAGTYGLRSVVAK